MCKAGSMKVYFHFDVDRLYKRNVTHFQPGGCDGDLRTP